MDKYCPLLIAEPSIEEIKDCQCNPNCAWWNSKGDGECAIPAIAKALQQIASKVSLQ